MRKTISPIWNSNVARFSVFRHGGQGWQLRSESPVGKSQYETSAWVLL
jgi:hypothetical protein